jgi:hypothetical protein
MATSTLMAGVGWVSVAQRMSVTGRHLRAPTHQVHLPGGHYSRARKAPLTCQVAISEPRSPGPGGPRRRHRQEKSRTALGGGEIQRASGSTIDRIVVPRRPGRIPQMGDLFLRQMGDVFASVVCFDTGLARGKWGIAALPIPHSAKVGAVHAEQDRRGGFTANLLAVRLLAPCAPGSLTGPYCASEDTPAC